MENIAELQKVHYTYSAYEEGKEGLRVLKGIDLSVAAGTFTAIIGRNGSGKSTLAKHLNALLLPTEGTVWVCGMDTKDEAQLWNIRQNAGMVFQNPDNQLVSSVVEEDVAFGPENLGVPRQEIRLRVDEALKAVNMSAFAHHAPHLLSGGQKQRIAIAGILAMKPRVLVMDEPTAMLDPQGRAEVMETVVHLCRDENIAVILITHYMEEALLADHVVVMDDGQVQLEGSPRDVFTHLEELKAAGVDVPPMADLTRILRQRGLDLPGNPMTIEEMAEALCPYLQKN